MANKKVNVKLKAFDHKKIDTACTKIIETVKRTGGSTKTIEFKQQQDVVEGI